MNACKMMKVLGSINLKFSNQHVGTISSFIA